MYVFYTYHNLQGSQTMCQYMILTKMFYTYHNLQGSQTHSRIRLAHYLFYTYHNLQGSQTSNDHLQTYILGSTVNYNFFILQLNIYLCLQ